MIVYGYKPAKAQPAPTPIKLARCSSEEREPASGAWQPRVIFQVQPKGANKILDYCREQPRDEGIADADIRTWADKHCERLEREQPGDAFTYRIEKW